ncbi:MAG: DegT/DnrJ/EryC1/StrS family aminotransferase [Balneolaceae bacterium]
MIPVTKPFVPPLSEYNKYLEAIWEREYFTNNGPLVQELEKRLKTYLDIKNILFVSNGTIALQLAIKVLGLKGEVITTPFSYVATTSSIVWEGCEPRFVDIDPETLNIDPNKIEEAITPETSAILATHVFGNPCDIDHIQEIADKHGLKVIYDAAHCFGTSYKGQSVLEYGDISTTSFHATKLFHTVEGGAVCARDEDLNHRMSRMRNFGHAGYEEFKGVGINGKNSEFHAAMGLCNLNQVEKILQSRKKQCLLYYELLNDSPIQSIKIQANCKWNYAYYPVIFENEALTLQVKKVLEKNDIYPRRYFYPSLDTLDYVKTEKVNVSKDISTRIMCLPLYFDLTDNDQKKVSKIILEQI